MPDLRDTRQRLARAQTNIQRLDTEVAAWYATDPLPHRVGHELYDGNRGRLRARILKDPPDEWGLLVGDIVNDLRFALDYMAYQLVIAETGQDPPLDPRGIEFPIYLKKEGSGGYFEFDKRGKPVRRSGVAKAARMPEAARTYIESIQPYNTGGGVNDWLWMLAELCNTNKHRLIQATPATLHATDLTLTFENATFEDFVAFKVDKLIEGALLAEFRMVSHEQKSHIRIEASLNTQITAEPGPPGHGEPLVRLMQIFHSATEVVYNELRPLVESAELPRHSDVGSNQ